MSRVDGVAPWLAPLGLRVLLAWEFFEAGREKLQGDNWFADLGDKFPLPFSLLGADLNWTLATWTELAGAAALLLGLGTRYVATALWVLTVVAIYAVHWPSDWSSLAELWQGYAISDDGHGNYKLPLIYLAMLLPLMLGGAGRLSLDRLLASRRAPVATAQADRLAWGVVLLGLGATVSLLLPWVGATLAFAGIALTIKPRDRNASNRLSSAVA
ncbi:HvfX family Cu-binding RiPP maturation protein [Lysobacter capsici]|uniref:HvfX family Cu-binding RiPP maturation protein n=1 Tax=Lysobacter capsici TaxID=435897 RepID=UPI001C003540|nr:DoxX family protein [Lysobacter capsici]MBW8810270.1 DoxX family protein [Lysobacter sp.]QWF17114.1 DoxX family protein [Lysobacter capsici]